MVITTFLRAFYVVFVPEDLCLEFLPNSEKVIVDEKKKILESKSTAKKTRTYCNSDGEKVEQGPALA
jgi:hypothetical protein